MQNVTLSNFESEVIAASQQVPVLVDFWAPWCGPCKVMGPLLEKLEAEYTGRFKLVKIDSEQEQQLAAAFGIRSIPAVVLLMNGKPADGFSGALSESQIKEFLDKHLPPAPKEANETNEADALAELARTNPDAALEPLQEAMEADPDSVDTRFNYVLALLKTGQLDTARTTFAPVAAQADTEPRLAALRLWLQTTAAAQNINPSAALDDLDRKIALNKRDFTARYQRAELLLGQARFTEALDELLEILMRDKTWNEELARKSYVLILLLIEPPKVKVTEGQIPPEDPTFATYRRRLSSVVLS